MDITQLPSRQRLEALSSPLHGRQLRHLFAEDPQRVARFSLELPKYLLDFSQNLIDEEIFVNLLQISQFSRLGQCARTGSAGSDQSH